MALAADAVPSSALYPTEVVEHTDGDCPRLEKILPQLAATREVITGDGYTGLLTLDTTSIKTEASGYMNNRAVSEGIQHPFDLKIF